MTRRLILFAVLAVLAAPFAARAQSGRMATIDDPIKVEFKNPAGLTMERLNDVITTSAASLQWRRVAEGDGRMELSRTVKDRYMMRVELSYDARGYTIRYLESVNLRYKEQVVDGQNTRLIHRSYNHWVRELATGINAGLGVSAQIVAGP